MPGSNPFESDLDKNPANYAPLSPLGFIERAAYVYPSRTASSTAGGATPGAKTYARCRRLASALVRRGIGVGDAVAAMLANTPRWSSAISACPWRGPC